MYQKLLSSDALTAVISSLAVVSNRPYSPRGNTQEAEEWARRAPGLGAVIWGLDDVSGS